jgi:phenylpropionate dioxygenase-like ring-hydroxylating dioxygenase large terminal subunit
MSPATNPASFESTTRGNLPRGCTFTESDWRALPPFWFAFSHEVNGKPYAARLLDERAVVYRLSDGSLAAANDICYHRGAAISLGRVKGDQIICKYHGLRYNVEEHCTCIPTHPKGAISARLRSQMFSVREAYGLVWVRLIQDANISFPEMKEWQDPDYIQVFPDSVSMSASAGQQIEGFLEVSHFCYIQQNSFGEAQNTRTQERLAARP